MLNLFRFGILEMPISIGNTEGDLPGKNRPACVVPNAQCASIELKPDKEQSRNRINPRHSPADISAPISGIAEMAGAPPTPRSAAHRQLESAS